MDIAEIGLSDADRAELRQALLNWKAEGQANPLIPFDVDIDGDGIADSFGLDENDELVFVSGATLDSTVYQSDGDDIRNES